MDFSRWFINRPIGTILLAIAFILAGAIGLKLLPIAALPQVEFPTITVSARLPGASPEVVAKSVTAPLERYLGAITGITEMTSETIQEETDIYLTFKLNRNINSAARDVQAAINAAQSELPSGLRKLPSYRKANNAKLPILVLALTSETLSRPELYDFASFIIDPALSKIPGVGDIKISGSAAAAIRVELDLPKLFHYGLSSENIANQINRATSQIIKGEIQTPFQYFPLYQTIPQKVEDYQKLVIYHRNQQPIHLQDIAKISNSVEDSKKLGLLNNKPAVIILIRAQSDSNVIETVKNIKQVLPSLYSALPANTKMVLLADQTQAVQAAFLDTSTTLLLTILLVVIIVYCFLRNKQITFIPSIAVATTLMATIATMWLFGFTLNLFSLMALTIAIGFIADDAIIVVENISRRLEKGVPVKLAILTSMREISGTLLSMSLVLLAVILPPVLTDNFFGRMFKAFIWPLAMAIGFSLVISLTLTPSLCSRLLMFNIKEESKDKNIEPEKNLFQNIFKKFFYFSKRNLNISISKLSHLYYGQSLRWMMRRPSYAFIGLALAIAANLWLFNGIPKGLIPNQDTDILRGYVVGDQNASFQMLKKYLTHVVAVIRRDPAVINVVSSLDGNQGIFLLVTLKPKQQRQLTADGVIARLRPTLAKQAGLNIYLHPARSLQIGMRSNSSDYSYTLLSDDSRLLNTWTKKLSEVLKRNKHLVDVYSDATQGGLESYIDIDREAAAYYSITPNEINQALYNAFGQHRAAANYQFNKQSYIIVEAAPEYSQNLNILNQIVISTHSSKKPLVKSSNLALSHAHIANNDKHINTTKAMIPLAAIATFSERKIAAVINHQAGTAAQTISFSLSKNVTLSDALKIIEQSKIDIGTPDSIRGIASGAASIESSSSENYLILFLIAILIVYFVLGVLYENAWHPLTILSTLPPASCGALLALWLFNFKLDIISAIGIVLVIGLSMKNVIMVIDVAIVRLRKHNSDRLNSQTSQYFPFPSISSAPAQAIYRACLIRFRPIMMTTLTTMIGALPLALGTGSGAELRHGLGVAIIGGALINQILTLYTIPAIFCQFEKWGQKMKKAF